MAKTFQYDFKNKEFVLKDGKLVPTEDIKVWIEKILRTQKDRYHIYENTDYGIALEDLIVGTRYPQKFTESEIKREVEQTMFQNPRIKEVRNLTLTDEKKIEYEVILDDNTAITGTTPFQYL